MESVGESAYIQGPIRFHEEIECFSERFFGPERIVSPQTSPSLQITETSAVRHLSNHAVSDDVPDLQSCSEDIHRPRRERCVLKCS